MNKKYELTDETLGVGTTKMYRIRSLRDFSDVKEGDLGGYIESESNLSHDGNCWVYDEAQVFAGARIYDNAIIARYAKAFYGAEIFENARVCGATVVFNKGKVYGSAQTFNNVSVINGAVVHSTAKIYRWACICDNANIGGDCIIDTHDDSHTIIRGITLDHGVWVAKYTVKGKNYLVSDILEQVHISDEENK
jgi:UDP-3-O-[3-hydroxymyristoyl] glucosamine N-acyltransferase